MAWTCQSVKTLLGSHSSGHCWHVVPIRCKRWTCKPCAQKNLKSLIDRIKRGRPDKLLTLTAGPHLLESESECYNRHRPLIRRLVQWIRRNYGSFEYAAICERHRSGFPHWHLVCRCRYIPQRELSEQWCKLTGSKIVDIRKIKNARHAACYVAKYVSKNVGHQRPLWMKRVVGFSKHFAPRRIFLKPDGFTYQLRLDQPDSYLRSKAEDGLIVVPVLYGTLLFDAGEVWPEVAVTMIVGAQPPPENSPEKTGNATEGIPQR